MLNASSVVIGRFAPSPSGELHLGSLVAAVASYLQTKSQHGYWFLRIDDLDPPRVKAGSIASIQRTLDAFGFEWDACVYQSQRHEHYQAAISQLATQGQIYACQCSRSQLKQRGAFRVYDRHCLHHPIGDTNRHVGWRLDTRHLTDWQWKDQLQGMQHLNWQQEIGDFLLQRTDRVFAYHLACAIDDGSMGITHVVRGADLLSSTPPQQVIQSFLGLHTPIYAHHPLLVDPQTGIKLSKASAAQALDRQQTSTQLWQALAFLQQSPPQTLRDEQVQTVWQWAITHWEIGKLKPAITQGHL